MWFGLLKLVKPTISGMIVSTLKWTFLVASSMGLLVACARDLKNSPSVLSTTNAPSQMSSQESHQDTNSDDHAALLAALDYAAKQDEDRIRGIPPPPSQFPFPNYDAGPLRPRPIRANFYQINDHFPHYLVCTYDVDEKKYSPSNESGWFKAALKQIRRSGSKDFPPIVWIAIVINNRAEWKDASKIDQAYRVGAIFKASEVFDLAIDVSQLVAQADMDRHPFKLEPKQSNPRLPRMPREEQRWLIVERHAATDNPATGTVRP